MFKLGFCIHGPNWHVKRALAGRRSRVRSPASSRFRHLKQAGPAPSPEQAHMVVTRPGRPGSEVLQRGWGGS